jgi:hypothetical protein
MLTCHFIDGITGTIFLDFLIILILSVIILIIIDEKHSFGNYFETF